MSADRDPRVDDLREQLRALGYLDAASDRFVLGGAVGTTRPLAFTVRASPQNRPPRRSPSWSRGGDRIAIAGDRLITSGSDALVVAVYLAVFFGLAVSLLAAWPCGWGRSPCAPGRAAETSTRTRAARRSREARSVSRVWGI
jgi:hypothetical protein